MIERICGKGEFCLLTSEGKSLLKKHWRFKRNTKAALAFFLYTYKQTKILKNTHTTLIQN